MATTEEVLGELREELKDPALSTKEFDKILAKIKKLEQS